MYLFFTYLISVEVAVIMERSPGIKNRKPEFTSQICIYLVSGLHQINSFRILGLEKQNHRNHLGQPPYLKVGETVLKICSETEILVTNWLSKGSVSKHSNLPLYYLQLLAQAGKKNNYHSLEIRIFHMTKVLPISQK